MRTLFNLLFRLTGHRVCCGRIPGWTAHVGQPWDTYDVAPGQAGQWLQSLERRRSWSRAEKEDRRRIRARSDRG